MADERIRDLTIDDDEDDVWVAHDHPGRALGPEMALCPCDPCFDALVAAAEREPRMFVVLETAADWIVVTAEYLAEVWSVYGSADPLCYLQRDGVRAVSVIDGWTPMGSGRWWSLARAMRGSGKKRGWDGGLKYATRSTSLEVAAAFGADHPRLPRGPLWPPVSPVIRSTGGRGVDPRSAESGR